VQALRVDAIADSGQSYGGSGISRLRRRRAWAWHPVVVTRHGMRYATDDGVALDALAPDEPLIVDGPNDVNENSVVLRMTYRCRRARGRFACCSWATPARSRKRGS
jgi:hypothetical protein